jgi:hypothetical protein
MPFSPLTQSQYSSDTSIGGSGANVDDDVRSYLRLDARINDVAVSDADARAVDNAVDGMARLNFSQRDAIRAQLRQRCTVLQGPPGTGKTTTVVHLLYTWVCVLRRPGPILASAFSNIGVDTIALGLVNMGGVRVCRIGDAEKCRPELKEHTLQYR